MVTELSRTTSVSSTVVVPFLPTFPSEGVTTSLLLGLRRQRSVRVVWAVTSKLTERAVAMPTGQLWLTVTAFTWMHSSLAKAARETVTLQLPALVAGAPQVTGVGVGLGAGLGLAAGDGDGDGLGDGVGDGEGDGLAEGDGLGLGDTAGDGEVDGEGVGDAPGEGEGEPTVPGATRTWTVAVACDEPVARDQVEARGPRRPDLAGSPGRHDPDAVVDLDRLRPRHVPREGGRGSGRDVGGAGHELLDGERARLREVLGQAAPNQRDRGQQEESERDRGRVARCVQT